MVRRGILRAGWLAIFLGWTAAESRAAQAPSDKPPVALSVSRQTTYLTEPLRTDGYVDYLAALETRYRQGVTAENNATVLWWRALDPAEIGASKRQAYFRRLGIAPPPPQRQYYVTWDKYLQRSSEASGAPLSRSKAREMLATAGTRPWTAKEYPLLAGWLTANQEPLRRVIEASQRPRRYEPLIAEEDGLPTEVLVMSPPLVPYQDAAQALGARAMGKVGQGKIEEAWEDLLAVHRLARLAGQGPALVDFLVAVAADATACDGDNALLAHRRLTSAQAIRMGDELRRLPPLPQVAEKIDGTERFMFLDTISLIARDGGAALRRPDRKGSKPDSVLDSVGDVIGKATVDWNLVARQGNAWFDRIATAYRMPVQAERKAALNEILRDTRRLSQARQDWKSASLAMLADPRKATSERTASTLITRAVPVLLAATYPEDRAAMRFDLARLAFALAAYRADHGTYPEQLADLTPQYAAGIPVDLFNAQPLRYRREGGGCLLYSVGVNGKDEDGKGYEDANVPYHWDDLAIRLPGHP